MYFVCMENTLTFNFVWCHGLFKLLQLSSWLKGLKEWHIQEVVSGCLVQVDFQLFSGHFSLVRSGRRDHCRTSQWKIKMKYALFRSFFCCCHCFFWKNYHSPSCTLLRICRSDWIVWIKCEILIIDVRNHLDGQLWQL